MEKGSVVRSLAGHDSGALYVVLEVEEPWLWLIDGKGRTGARPKKKQRRHVELLGHWAHPALERLAKGQAVTDREIRRALAAFRDAAKEV